MEKLGRKIVKYRIPIFLLALILLIPSVIGYIKTRSEEHTSELQSR